MLLTIVHIVMQAHCSVNNTLGNIIILEEGIIRTYNQLA
jgi:hypothetical protein